MSYVIHKTILTDLKRTIEYLIVKQLNSIGAYYNT